MSTPSPARPWGREDLPDALQTALNLAIEKNARNPEVLNVTDIAGYTDWVLLLSGRSERHVAGIADGIARGLRAHGLRPRGTEGLGDHRWDLLDYDDFIIHVFYHPVRLHYDLESMLRDAPRVPLDLPDEVFDTSDLDKLETTGELPEFRGDLMFGGYSDEFDDEDEDELEEDSRF